MSERAIFLDKDGTLIRDVPYNVEPGQIELYPETGEALRRLGAAGFRLIVISNQSGVAHGYFEEQALTFVEVQLQVLLRPYGVSLDGFYYCPHHPGGSVPAYSITCACRKPEPGLLTRAAADHDLNLEESWMIGDILNDVEAGNRAGCRTVLLEHGNETEWLTGSFRTPTYRARHMLDAAEFILKHTTQSVSKPHNNLSASFEQEVS
ncbi:D-glycero-alpha-D-manno-heptose-1,7-bisphosphate 7-phosphatase [Tellurirhabdus rosea]|uniref:D-glycero-alpha-D-manno-heptose-1,7-bisphosphate 7-phosphatase n=1 Tax=Tellurirhabdus rosea TaxID=2674997 RepID=UPI00225526E2|nr:HAD family hydrolase [Tellurirhabdus rosea]